MNKERENVVAISEKKMRTMGEKEPLFRIEKNDKTLYSWKQRLLIRSLSVAGALLFASLLAVVFIGIDPITFLGGMIDGVTANEYNTWKFLWNANVFEYIDGRINEDGPWDKTNFKYRHEFIYPLTKQGISDFLHRDDVIIVSEYYDDCEPEYSKDDDKLTADEFLEMAFNWSKDDGFDGKTYREWQIKNGESTYDYYDQKTCEKWERLGYELNSSSDFYSDGLRFSTSDWFA